MKMAEEFIKKKKSNFSKGKDRFIMLDDIGRKGKYRLEKEAMTLMPQHNIKSKVFIIERLRIIDIVGKTEHAQLKVGDIEYRICYFIIGKIGRARNTWWWGQSCPLIPIEDFQKLIKLAEKEGTILD